MNTDKKVNTGTLQPQDDPLNYGR